MDASLWFGPYRLIRELRPARIGPADTIRRWAAVHDRDRTGHLVYSLGPARDRFTKKRMLAAAEAVVPLRQAHVLGISCYALSDRLGMCMVAPYPGHQSGVVTLADLVEEKGGRLSLPEAQRAARHLLEALAAVHAAGVADGSLGPDRVHVDPRGSLLLELPGLHRALRRRGPAGDEDYRADVRALAAMVGTLITGSPKRGEPEPLWRSWLARGTDAVEGFASAAAALAALPGAPAPQPAPPGIVRTFIDRIRGALPLL